MKADQKLKVILLALTGFGNKVLEALLQESNVIVEAVFTEKYDQPFPYYEEKQLINLCGERHIPCYYNVKLSGEEGIALVKKHHPDLILVATFKQILKKNVLDVPVCGVVNFHPSLLPAYRGPCPTNAALLNNDTQTGITVHYITEEVDKGNILMQKSLKILKSDNDGQLRLKLASLAADMVPEVIRSFSSSEHPLGTPQIDDEGSYAPKPKIEDGYLEISQDIQGISRKIRAYNPLPGTSIQLEDKRISVNRFETLSVSRPDGIFEETQYIDLYKNGQGIRLFKK